jgi:hypothetical protein
VFTIVEPYVARSLKLYHFDLYRLAHPEELAYIGARDYFSEDAICLIEWPENGKGFIPVADIVCSITMDYDRSFANRFLEYGADRLEQFDLQRDVPAASERSIFDICEHREQGQPQSCKSKGEEHINKRLVTISDQSIMGNLIVQNIN